MPFRYETWGTSWKRAGVRTWAETWGLFPATRTEGASGKFGRSRIWRKEQWWELPDGRRYYGTRRAMADVVRDLVGEPPTAAPRERKRVTVKAETTQRPIPVYIPSLDTSAIEAARARAEREIALSRQREAAAMLTYQQWEDDALVLLLMSS